MSKTNSHAKKSGAGALSASLSVRDSDMVFQNLRTSMIASETPPGNRTLPKVMVKAAASQQRAGQPVSDETRQRLRDVFVYAWDNVQLYSDFSVKARSGEYNVQDLGKRARTLDYSELLELLKTLNLLPEREGYADPGGKITHAMVHDVFEAVNMQSFKKFHMTAGQSGDRNRTEMIFEEYQMLMLTLAASKGLDVMEIAHGDAEVDNDYLKSVQGMVR